MTPLTLPDLVSDRRDDRDAVVLSAPGGEVTRTDLARLADMLARTLVASGLDAGDHVAVTVPDGAAFLHALFGALRAGAVVVLGALPDALPRSVRWHIEAAATGGPPALRVSRASAAAWETVPLDAPRAHSARLPVIAPEADALIL